MRTAVAFTSLAVAATCTLAACGGGSIKTTATSAAATSSAAAATTDSLSTAATTVATTTTSAAATTTSAATTAAAAPSGSFTYTPQGSKLELGQTATVPFKYGKDTGVIGIRITAVTMGTAADLKPLKLGSRGAGLIPWFVRATITNLGGTNLAYSSVGDIHGSLADGSAAQDVIVFGTFSKCASGSATADFTKGASYQTCNLAVAPKGVKLAGGQYNDDEAKALHARSDFYTAPLQWK